MVLSIVTQLPDVDTQQGYRWLLKGEHQLGRLNGWHAEEVPNQRCSPKGAGFTLLTQIFLVETRTSQSKQRINAKI